ncbi:hypothetical protein OKA05_20810 [Luteolibacter arcticus]|uniref:Integral membrane protein n=1 Tax=Luteolibacter arcticus TaxID=1581411 RepID=A0ABT3GNF9_9BACT|nr:hypothetical protein [Luteolibacter arcticus]MCW1925016.1 hypothetical protein [Luteolibacter arcticus]
MQSRASADIRDFQPVSQPIPRVQRFLSALAGSTTLVLRWACAALFIGRAWQHLFVGTPYRPILFSQSLMEGFVGTVFGLDWTTWATSPVVESNLALATRFIGVVLALCAVAALVTVPRRTWSRLLLASGTTVLAVIAFAVYRDKLLRVGELFELACAISAPVALLLATRPAGAGGSFLRHGLAVAVAATFAAHGLYAVGYYPLPGEWVTMAMTILRLGEQAAVTFLFAAGVLDFLVALTIFIPRLSVAAAAYAFAWGLLTASARVVANVTPENFHESALFWIPEMLVRLPNALLPLVVLGLLVRGLIPDRRRDETISPPAQATAPKPETHPLNHESNPEAHRRGLGRLARHLDS